MRVRALFPSDRRSILRESGGAVPGAARLADLGLGRPAAAPRVGRRGVGAGNVVGLAT